MERMEWEKTIKSWLDDFSIATGFSLGGVNLLLSLCYYCYATENRFKEDEKERKSAKGFLFLGLSVVNATIMIDFEKQIKDKNTTGSKILNRFLKLVKILIKLLAGATLLLLGITIGDMSKYKDNEELSVLILLFFTNITFICLLFYLVRYKYTTRDIMAYQERIISEDHEHGSEDRATQDEENGSENRATQDEEHGSEDRATQDEEHGSEDIVTQLTQNNDRQLSVSTLRNEQLVQVEEENDNSEDGNQLNEYVLPSYDKLFPNIKIENDYANVDL